MKNNLMKILIAAALVSVVVLLAACGDTDITTEKATLPPNRAAAPTVNGGEVVSINPDAAIDIALKHAGAAREDAVMYGTPTLDANEKKPHYDIKFAHNGFEYEYEVAVGDGAVIKAEKEPKKRAPASTNKPAAEKPAAPESTKPAEDKKLNSGYISVEVAKQKALENAGVTAANATFLKAYYDSDDIVPHFDIKFIADGYEYEYEIKASDGKVLEKEVDREVRTPKTPKATAAAKEYITAAEAKKLAFAHAGIAAGNVKYSAAELDRDDMVVHYDVEFVAGKYEYEYEINAVTGKIIAYDKDIND